MYILIFVISTYFSKLVAPVVFAKCECGIQLQNRIIGGKETVPDAHPWMVAIMIDENLHCGGSIISEKYVLTAGHCVRWTSIKKISIVIGMHKIKSIDGKRRSIESIILHEHFFSFPMYDNNDIALIKLKHAVKFSNKLTPICLPTQNSDYTNKKVKIVGWGRDENGHFPDALKETTITILTANECHKTPIATHLNSMVFCAYGNNTDGCQGDSGGPAELQNLYGNMELIGVISWGFGCASPTVPGVYTDVSKYLGWIHTNANDATFCVIN